MLKTEVHCLMHVWQFYGLSVLLCSRASQEWKTLEKVLVSCIDCTPLVLIKELNMNYLRKKNLSLLLVPIVKVVRSDRGIKRT